MANLPPAKFWSWANISNILLIIGFTASAMWFVYNQGQQIGADKERMRLQSEQESKDREKMLRDIDQLQKLIIPEQPEPTPTPRKK